MSTPLGAGRRGRLIAIGLLLAVVALAAALVAVPAMLLHRHYDVALEDLLDKLQRYRRVAAQQEEWKSALDGLRARDRGRFLLRNSAMNLAGAELQDAVRVAIESHGGRIITVQVVPVKEEGRFRQVGISVQMFAPTATLQQILLALESQQPYLFIDNLTLRATAFRGYRPSPGVEPEVSALMDVSAFAFPGGEK